MAGFPEYDRYDALGLAGLVRDKEISAAELLETAIARAEAGNERLNFIAHRLYDAAREAVAKGLPRGPFTGVPFMLKDLGATQKGVPTSSGSRFFDGYVATVDATITERYRAAGLVVLARTTTPEFGINASTEPVLIGPTRNPWNTAAQRRRLVGRLGGGGRGARPARRPRHRWRRLDPHSRLGCGLFGLKPTRARNPSGPDLGEGWSGMSAGHVVTVQRARQRRPARRDQGAAPGDPYPAPPAGAAVPAGGRRRSRAAAHRPDDRAARRAARPSRLRRRGARMPPSSAPISATMSRRRHCRRSRRSSTASPGSSSAPICSTCWNSAGACSAARRAARTSSA